MSSPTALASRRTTGGRATLTVSIDLEMVWGVVHHGTTAPYEAFSARSGADERDVLVRLLALCDAHDVPVTWATVGHLMLEDCPAPLPGALKHAEMPRTFHPGNNDDWFDLDPASSRSAAPNWYAPDMVRRVRDAVTPHEIGSHGFSHIEVLPDRVPAGAFAKDLDLAAAAAAPHDLTLRSYVYPRNAIGHLPVLADVGYDAFRAPPAWIDEADGTPIVDDDGTRLALVTSGVVAMRHTHFLRTPHVGDHAGSLRFRGQMARLRQRLRQAPSTAAGLHLWFHGHDLLPNPDLALAELGRLFRAAARLRDRGDVEIVTMGQRAAAIQAAAS